MKKIIFSLAVLISIGILFSFAYINSNSTSKSSSYRPADGIGGQITAPGGNVSGRVVHLTKGGFDVGTTTDSNGYYHVDDGDLDGTGTYTATTHWCEGNDALNGQNTGNYNGNPTSIDVSCSKLKGGCTQ